MSGSRCELLRWQFEFTWSLFEYHLERLEPEDFPVGTLRELLDRAP